MIENEKITVQTTVAVDLEKAWDAYTRPEHITQWNFADPSWHCPQARNNQTEVSVAFDPETENALELQRNGWQAILDNYRKHTESL
jgi:uncharacterized protein YndB with AHSA1/START domain